MNRYEISVLTAFIISLIFAQVTAFASSCEEVREGTIRVHIMANSNSEADQNIKLDVRDEIIQQVSSEFLRFDDIGSAKEGAQELLSMAVERANEVLKENLLPYKASGEIVNMYFPTKSYGEITMPAGEYAAVRIYLGSAEGENWWCVMYPPLCLPTASEHENEDAEKIYELNEKAEFVPAFAVVEWYEGIREKWQNN